MHAHQTTIFLDRQIDYGVSGDTWWIGCGWTLY
jgi:hypothetical protein